MCKEGPQLTHLAGYGVLVAGGCGRECGQASEAAAANIDFLRLPCLSLAGAHPWPEPHASPANVLAGQQVVTHHDQLPNAHCNRHSWQKQEQQSEAGELRS